MPKETRFQRVRKKQQVENEHNMVLANYVMQKYGPIADDALECYKWLKKNWPNGGKPYKRTKNMRDWLRGKISTYIAAEEAADQQQLPAADQQQLTAADQQQQLPAADQQQQQQLPAADQQQLPAADQQQQLPAADQQLPAADQQQLPAADQQQLPAADQQQLPAEAVEQEQHGGAEALLAELDARVGELLEIFANEEDEGIEVEATINTPVYEHLYPEEYDGETYDFDLGINMELPPIYPDPLEAEHY